MMAVLQPLLEGLGLDAARLSDLEVEFPCLDHTRQQLLFAALQRAAGLPDGRGRAEKLVDRLLRG